MSELIAIQRITRQELDVQIATAKAYPRDIATFSKRAVSLATTDQDTAESCIYALPRRNKQGKQDFLKGPSIRLAEIITYAWGNIHSAARIVENNGRTIDVEAVVWDLETNNKATKPLRKSIVGKDGNPYSQDMQTMTANAAIAICWRNAVFSIIPKPVFNPVYIAALNYAIGDQTKLQSKIVALFDRFQKMGIDKEKILEYFQHANAAEITVDEVEEMIGIGTAIKEKSLLIDDAFKIEVEKNQKTNLLNDKLSGEN